MQVLCVVFVSIISLYCVFCQDTDLRKDNVTSVTETTTSPHDQTTTAIPVNTTCEQFTTCEECTKIKECYFCESNKLCTAYVLKEVLPNKECKLKNAYYGTCTINLLAVVVLIGIGSSIVFIGLLVCCCCCCCRRNGIIKLSKDDLKWARQREERRLRAEEKRKERSSRTEEIRKKYGLFKDDSPYQRFDA